jgi:hypothetical protein
MVNTAPTLEQVLDIIEKRRMKVLLDKTDPSWTEHFAELQNEIRDLWAREGICNCESRGIEYERDGQWICGYCRRPRLIARG